MSFLGDLPLWASGLVFICATIVVVVVGSKLAKLADEIADLTGIGEAVTGALFLGAATSLSGIVTSVIAATEGRAEMAISNAIGGIAAQTFFLAIADVFYRRANLEHAAPSLTNLVYGALIICLLTIVLLTQNVRPFEIAGIHVASILIVAGYVLGLRIAIDTRTSPMWGPMYTSETQLDIPAEIDAEENFGIYPVLLFCVLAIVVATCGFVIAGSGLEFIGRGGLSETIVGTLFTGVATSTPELVTTLAAIRRGALTLAVGGIMGGNAFDVLFVSFSDVAYKAGSIYHAITSEQSFVILVTNLMICVLLLGLLRRQRHGIANIGFESALVIVLYIGGMMIVSLGA